MHLLVIPKHRKKMQDTKIKIKIQNPMSSIGIRGERKFFCIQELVLVLNAPHENEVVFYMSKC
jgi:hypothetical protein